MSDKKTLTYEEAHEWFRYEDGKLYWRKGPSGKIKEGYRAGHTSKKSGYRSVYLRGKSYLEHRLIWLLLKGRWPNKFLDHINRDKSDNRVENLREATNRQNQRNSALSKRNSTGYKGVILSPFNKSNPYKAQIVIDGKQRSLGYYPTAELAHLAYVEAANEHFGEFACAG